MKIKLGFEKIRRKIIVLKYTQSRGYMWCQSVVMSILAAGVLKPYFPNVKFYQLILLALAIFMTIGFIDRKLKFLDEEASYATERNTLLMKGLKGELKEQQEVK